MIYLNNYNQCLQAFLENGAENKGLLQREKTSGTASATVLASVAMPPPPPLMAQPGNQNQVQGVEVEEGLGDILFEVAGELPPMNQYNVQYVREENGTTYMKM